MVPPEAGSLEFTDSFSKYTHYLFRYPAKFHPPVAGYLINEFSARGEFVLDPFCGSGTLLVEGAVRSRSMVGVDIDPVAAFISRVKTTKLSAAEERDLSKLGQTHTLANSPPVAPPAIPNIHHWFEPHVLSDMCSLRGIIEQADLSENARNVATAVFLGRVRSWSNADPVPVSGLEVTSHIKEKRKNGHYPDVLGSFITNLKASVERLQEYARALPNGSARPLIVNEEASEFLRKTRRKFNAIITSPPYLSAVDYYRRHTLEMYWLDQSLTPKRRIQIRSRYIGQYTINQQMLARAAGLELSRSTLTAMQMIEDPKRLTAAKHYFLSMKRALQAAIGRLKPEGLLVIVLGDGHVGRTPIPTGRLLAEELAPVARWERAVQYPLRNRYMTYSRRNGADIAHETIYVLRKI